MFIQLLKTFLRKRFGYGLKLSEIYQLCGTTLVLAPFLANPAIKKTVPQIQKQTYLTRRAERKSIRPEGELFTLKVMCRVENFLE